MVERLAAVKGQKACLTKEGLRETIDATERRGRCRTEDTVGETSKLGGGFRLSNFIHKFIVVSIFEEFFHH